MDGRSERPTGSAEASGSAQERRTRPRFPWPPPGLEAEHGRLWHVLFQLGLGSLVLVFPLLLAVARVYPFWSFGLFGGAWWVLVLTSMLGLLITLAGLESLFRILRQASQASRWGLGSFITLLVMSDRRRDGGFLLQGGRKYRGLEVRRRGRIARSRVLGSASLLLGTLWIPLGFSLSVFFAARGILSPSGMWLISLVPAGILLAIGIVSRGLEGTLIQKAEPGKDILEEEIRGDVIEWLETLGAYSNREGLDVGSPAPAGRRAFGWSALGVVVIAVIVFMPAAAITVTSTMGPILALVATPNFSRMNERAATAQVFQRFRNEPDSSITPIQAGEALHALGYVGDQRTLDLMQIPVREYDEPWFPDVLREGLVEVLSLANKSSGFCDALAPVFARLIDDMNANTVLDLCSGAGGPIEGLLQTLTAQGHELPQVLLSDLYPKVEVWKRIEKKWGGKLSFVEHPVDATTIDDELRAEVVTVINALHHFPLELVRAMFAEVVRRNSAIFVGEAFGRSLYRGTAYWGPLVLGAARNPFVCERNRLLKAALFGPFPLMAPIGLWDWFASVVRIHEPDELVALGQEVGPHYSWEKGAVPFGSWGQATYVCGVPPKS